MAKTKRMFMGGVAKAVSQAVKSVPKFNAPPGTPKGTVYAGAPPPSGGPMGGIMSAVKQAAQAIPKSSVPPPGSPRRAPPPAPIGDTGTNIQKVDYAAQNAAGLGRPPPAGPGQMQFMSDKLRGNPGMPPPAGPGQMQFMSDKLRGAAAGMPPTVSGNQAKSMGLGMKNGGKVSSASSRGDGIATKGKTKGRFV